MRRALNRLFFMIGTVIVVTGGALVASSAPAAAAVMGCGDVCDFQNPQTYPAVVPVVGTVICASDAQTVFTSTVIMGRTVELRYSPNCRTAWGRLLGGVRLDRVWLRHWVVEGGLGHWAYLVSYDFVDLQNRNWTTMWQDEDYTVSACLAPNLAPGRDELMLGCTSLPGGFHVHNLNSGNCLASRSGAGERPVIQTSCDDPSHGSVWADQYWHLVPVNPSAGEYRIRSILLGLCIAARGSGESPAIATTCGAGGQWVDQIWTIRYDGTKNADQYVNKSSDLCLVARGSGESQAVQSTCATGQNWRDQYWY